MSDAEQWEKRRRATATAIILSTSAAAIATYAARSSERQAQRTSILSSFLYTQELLNGHSGTFYDILGMPKNCFYKILAELVDYGELSNNKGLGLTALEKLVIFLYMCRSAAPFSFICDRFQHSSSTISMYVVSIYVSVLPLIFWQCFRPGSRGDCISSVLQPSYPSSKSRHSATRDCK